MINEFGASAAPIDSSTLPPPGYVDVLWSVRLRADSAEAGATIARVMQYDPSSLASVYRCRDSQGVEQVIDLQGASIPH